MSVEIFDYNYHLPIRMRPQIERILISKGHGYEEFVTRGVSHSGADGVGGQTARKIRWVFEIEIRAQDYEDGAYQDLVDFLLDHWESGEAFYFYNALENPRDSETWTGATSSSGTDRAGNAITNATGRYLVRILEDQLSWDVVSSRSDFVLTFHQVFE